MIGGLFARIKDKQLEVLLRGSIGFFILRVLGMGATLGVTVMISRWYGAAVLGIYSMSVAAFRISMLLGRAGLDNALVKFIAQFAAKEQWDRAKSVYLKAIKIGVSGGILVGLGLYFLAPTLAARVFEKVALADTLWIIALIVLPGVLLNLNASSLRGLKRIGEYSFLLNAAPFIAAALLIPVFTFLLPQDLFPSQYWIPVTAFALGITAAAIVSFFLGGRQWRKRKEKPGNGMKSGELLKVAFPMLLSGSYSLFLAWTGTMVLGIYRPEAEVGIYEAVIKTAALITITLTAINSIVASQFSESHAVGDNVGLKKVVSHAKGLIFWTTFPVGLALLIFPGEVLGIFGKDIRGGETALMFLIFGYFVNAVSGPVGTLMNMTGHQVKYQNIMLGAAAVNVVLNIALVPSMGINGAAVAGMVSMALWNMASVIVVKKKFGFWTLYFPFLLK